MAERQKAAEQDPAVTAAASAPAANDSGSAEKKADDTPRRVRVAWPWVEFKTPDGMADLTRDWSEKPYAPETIKRYQDVARQHGVRLEVEQ